MNSKKKDSTMQSSKLSMVQLMAVASLGMMGAGHPVTNYNEATRLLAKPRPSKELQAALAKQEAEITAWNAAVDAKRKAKQCI